MKGRGVFIRIYNVGSTLTSLLFPIVFSTKNRDPMIEIQLRDELYRYIGGIVKKVEVIVRPCFVGMNISQPASLKRKVH